MKDLRLVSMGTREGMAFGVKEGIGTLVGGGILAMVGLYAYSIVSGKIDQSSFSAAENDTLASVRENVLGGFDTMSITFIILGIATFVGLLFVVFQ